MLLLTRRAFVAGLAAPVATAALRARTPPDPRVDGAALRSRLERLSTFGRPASGSFADGVSRVAYSDADLQGREYVIGLMRAAGLDTRIDPAGNIFGRRPGGDTALKPILFGSHIDSVPNGGNFDGDLGSLSALGAIEAFNAAGMATRHPLEMVVWAHEEGVAFGRGLACSRIVAGDIKPADMDEVWNGIRRADAIRRIGGDPDRILDARRPKGSWHCYLELHIEQGGTLDRAHIPVGVVEGIVAIDRYDAIVTGFANHAGTTPMNERQDALVAASQLALAVREVATREPGRQVGTVGHLELTPNAPNVIPGSARLTIEFRDLSTTRLEAMGTALRARAQDIASATGTRIELLDAGRNPPASASTDVQLAIERAAGGLTLESRRLPSGAGHDAQMMAQLVPMGMIFVPSVGGISHSPKELTGWQDCAQGADVLLRTVLEMDRVG
ncbi:MAG TPA: Zn-dependent hydrolase [Vicinamibacterales bacterium]|jgi:N-carbamoyl-L-amino-acid hydrolase|nr:Zn-dependent hydrolase [Vicinamibacterales bacterium]